MKNDLISRQAAIETAENVAYAIDEHGSAEGWLAMLVNSLEFLSSAQPEIIRCKDCKHWCEGDAYSYCQILFNCGVLDVYDYMRAEDDFCSLAERRQDG